MNPKYVLNMKLQDINTLPNQSSPCDSLGADIMRDISYVVVIESACVLLLLSEEKKEEKYNE